VPTKNPVLAAAVDVAVSQTYHRRDDACAPIASFNAPRLDPSRPAGAGAPRIRRHVQVLDHVVGVIDLGETPTGLLYLVMEYFEGRRRSLM
jgi:hypothetical protein